MLTLSLSLSLMPAVPVFFSNIEKQQGRRFNNLTYEYKRLHNLF